MKVHPGHGCHERWKVEEMGKITKKDISHAFYICLFALALAELSVLLFLHPHGTFWWEEIPCFNAIFGFLSCAILILVAKALGYWLKKEEDYYEKSWWAEERIKGVKKRDD